MNTEMQEEVFVSSKGFDFTRTSPFRSPPLRRQGFYFHPNRTRNQLPLFDGIAEAKTNVNSRATAPSNTSRHRTPAPRITVGSPIDQSTPLIGAEAPQMDDGNLPERSLVGNTLSSVRAAGPTFLHSTPAYWLNRDDYGTPRMTPLRQHLDFHNSIGRQTSSRATFNSDSSPAPSLSSTSRCRSSLKTTLKRLYERVEGVQRRVLDYERKRGLNENFTTMISTDESDDEFFVAPKIRIVEASPKEQQDAFKTFVVSSERRTHCRFADDSLKFTNNTSVWSTRMSDGGRMENSDLARSFRDNGTQVGSENSNFAPSFCEDGIQVGSPKINPIPVRLQTNSNVLASSNVVTPVPTGSPKMPTIGGNADEIKAIPTQTNANDPTVNTAPQVFRIQKWHPWYSWYKGNETLYS